MSSIYINDLWIEDSEIGEDVVLFIHGLGGSSNFWSPILSAFHGYRTIRPDLEGAGRSSKHAEQLSISRHVSSLITVIDELGIKKIHIVAHSMGTIIAQHLAVSHPERVRSLSLFGPFAAPTDMAREATRNRANQARMGNIGMQEIADVICKTATSTETKRERPVALALIRESIMRQPPEGYALNCEGLAEAQPADLKRLAIPVLLVTGDEDGVATPERILTMSEQLIDHQQFILNGCGHWTTYEKPFECIRILTDFYKNQ